MAEGPDASFEQTLRFAGVQRGLEDRRFEGREVELSEEISGPEELAVSTEMGLWSQGEGLDLSSVGSSGGGGIAGAAGFGDQLAEVGRLGFLVGSLEDWILRQRGPGWPGGEEPAERQDEQPEGR